MFTSSRRDGPRDGMFILGLVGRTGSGKSTVASALAADGAIVVEGDAIGHEVTDQDVDVRRALIAEYGSDVYAGGETLDRRRVAERVFRDPAARERLDRLVHPRIVERIRGRLERLRDDGFRGVAVIDAALLLEWGLERCCDAVVAIVAPESAQVERLRQSRGWSENEARLRLAAQRESRAFAAAADVTLMNDGTISGLERAARAAVASLREHRNRDAAPREPRC